MGSGTGAGAESANAGQGRLQVFKIIGKLIKMAIFLSIVAAVFNKVVKPLMNQGKEESA